LRKPNRIMKTRREADPGKWSGGQLTSPEDHSMAQKRAREELSTTL